MFLESKLGQVYGKQWTSLYEVFWQYPLVIPSQLEVEQPFLLSDKVGDLVVFLND